MRHEEVRLRGLKSILLLLILGVHSRSPSVYAEEAHSTPVDPQGVVTFRPGGTAFRPFEEPQKGTGTQTAKDDRIKTLVDALNSDRKKLIENLSIAKGKEAKEKAANELLKRLGKDNENPGPVPPELVKLVEALRDADGEEKTRKATDDLRKALSPDALGNEVKAEDLKKSVEGLKKAAVAEDREKFSKEILKQLGVDGLHAFRERGVLNKQRMKEALGLDTDEQVAQFDTLSRDPQNSVSVPITPGPLGGPTPTTGPDPSASPRPAADPNANAIDALNGKVPGVDALDPTAGADAAVDPNAVDDVNKLNDRINDLRNGENDRNRDNDNENRGRGKGKKKGGGGGEGEDSSKNDQGSGSGSGGGGGGAPPGGGGKGEKLEKPDVPQPGPPPDMSGLFKLAGESGKDAGLNPEIAKFLANPFGTGEKKENGNYADQVVGDIKSMFGTNMQTLAAMGQMLMSNINRPQSGLTVTPLAAKRNVRAAVAGSTNLGVRGRGRTPRVARRNGPRAREPVFGGNTERASPRGRAPARRSVR